MKRFLLFSYKVTYPEGGWDDFVADIDTPEELAALLQKSDDEQRVSDFDNTKDCFQMVDTKTGKSITELITTDRQHWTLVETMKGALL